MAQIRILLTRAVSVCCAERALFWLVYVRRSLSLAARPAPSSCAMLQLMAYSMLAFATTAPKVKLVAYEEAL